jgi:hypothetical protein
MQVLSELDRVVEEDLGSNVVARIMVLAPQLKTNLVQQRMQSDLSWKRLQLLWHELERHGFMEVNMPD